MMLFVEAVEVNALAQGACESVGRTTNLSIERRTTELRATLRREFQTFFVV